VASRRSWRRASSGPRPIIGIDILPKRLKLARELGATHTIDAPGRRRNRIEAITGSGVDYSVEGTGTTMSRLSMELLNREGTAALLTGASGPGRLPGGRKALTSSRAMPCRQRFIPRLIALYQRGLFPFDRLVKFYDFMQIDRAIADSMRAPPSSRPADRRSAAVSPSPSPNLCPRPSP